MDFTKLSDEEIVHFVDSNFALFANDRDENFPASVLEGIDKGVIFVIRRMEGFAIAFKGRPYNRTPGGIEADLMFLFVAPEHEGHGVGSQIIEQVKEQVAPGLSIILTCESVERKQYFERRGFSSIASQLEGDIYQMVWHPSVDI